MLTKNRTRTIEVLIIEDNQGDIDITRDVFEETETKCNLNFVYTGEEALEFLRRKGEYPNAPTPDIILLDLNLPGYSGREIIEKIKNDDAFKKIPVIVMTSSESQRDVYDAYSLHANCYIVKPIEMNEYVKIIKAIESFWFLTAVLPGDTE